MVLEFRAGYESLTHFFMFQSFFYWIWCWNCLVLMVLAGQWLVSILLLLDMVLELKYFVRIGVRFGCFNPSSTGYGAGIWNSGFESLTPPSFNPSSTGYGAGIVITTILVIILF